MAIVDDLGAIIVIAVFYTSEIVMPYLLLTVVVTAALIALNIFKVRKLSPYLILGMILWIVVENSGFMQH
jgi:NhaA family Na+:H+ antiporter